MGNTYEMEANLVRQPATALPEHLTPRQLDVLGLLCEGLSNKAIGRRLNISGATVKIHVARILQALNVSSRLQAVIAARSCGFEPNAGGVDAPRAPAIMAARYPFIVRLVLGDEDASRLVAATTTPMLAAAAG
jgi:DNA-binding CsgD family transcriptional regulator